MVKGWNRNRGWNNGWGSNRKNRNGSGDLTWVSRSTIETARRVQSEPTARPSEATRASEGTGTGEMPTEPIPVPKGQLSLLETASQPHKTGVEPQKSVDRTAETGNLRENVHNP